jgi:L-threonylcarbamoyladenylate synthase
MDYPEKEIAIIKEKLIEGKTILYPSDTVWAIGCDAQNEAAIERIYKMKACSKEQKFVLLVSGLEMLKQYVQPVPPKASNLIQYYERPLTIVYDQVENLPTALLSEDGSAAIRVSQDPFCRAFIEAFGGAIVATTAEQEGDHLPSCFEEVPSEIKAAVDYLVPHKLDQAAQKGASLSTIVRLDERNELIFLRK